jgi:arginyl-tRNA synthetase
MTHLAPEPGLSLDPVALLDARFAAAIAAAFPDAAGTPALIARSKQDTHGEFQCNAAMSLAKRVGKAPRDVAQALVQHADLTGLAEPLTPASIAGPGFINVRLLPSTLSALLARLDAPGLGITPPATPEVVVVDLCGVNLAKQMHVGHLRSTVIGDAIARLFERLGHRVIRQSHVGDWGLPIAMVVQKLVELEDAGHLRLDAVTLDTLNALYKAAQAECKGETVALRSIIKYGGHAKAQPELAERIAHAEAATERAKARLVALQSGDPRSVAVWQRVYDVTMAACLATCARLHAHVTDEHSAGESTYRTELAGVVDDLLSRGVAELSDGAAVVRVDGIEEPCLIRKSDGGFLYATTDLAAIRRRVRALGGSRVVYCVDARQSLHFRQVFGAAHKAGYDAVPNPRPDGTRARLEHAAFGSVLGEDGSPLKTRSGENVRLTDLLDEADARALAAVAAKNPDLPEHDRAAIARGVALAAIKYADLSIDRVKDYVFSFDRMLAFEGDTGPYLLNAAVRIRSIFRKAAESGLITSPEALCRAALDIAQPDEKTLALALLRYPGVVRAAGEHLEPQRLCAYLFELAGAFAGFYERCPVLRPAGTGDAARDEAVRASRLRLCSLTLRVLDDGLKTLGIPPIERM